VVIALFEGCPAVVHQGANNEKPQDR
jgi:hypothetical protein